jgi:hypothetical protein
MIDFKRLSISLEFGQKATPYKLVAVEKQTLVSRSVLTEISLVLLRQERAGQNR